MKLFKILGAFALASLVACSPEFDYKVVPAETLELETTNVKFLAENSAARVVTVESNAKWTASVDSLSQWISFEVVEGGLSILPENNPDIYERTGFVTLKTGNRSVDIKVVQAALGVNFVADPDSVIVFPAEGGSFDVKINSNISWDAVPSSAWAESNILAAYSGKGEQTLKITLPAREIGNDASLKVASGDITFTHDEERLGRISFTQGAVVPVITFSKDTLSADANAFSQKISVEANWPFTCVVGAADSLWLSAVLPTPLPSETGDVVYPAGKFELTVNGLETKPGRSGKFTFQTSDGAKFYVVVEQAGMPTSLTVTKTAISAPAAGSTESFSLTTNNAWEISGVPSWASLSKSSGDEGTHEITVTVVPSTEMARTATISVKAGDKTSDIVLSQANGPLSFYMAGTAANNYIKLDTYYRAGTDAAQTKFQSSIGNSYDLGPLTGYYVNASVTPSVTYKNMVFEFYCSGAFLINGTSGFRFKTYSDGKPLTNAIGAKERLGYIKFPAVEGYKFKGIKVFNYASSTSAKWTAFFSPTLGANIADAKTHAVSDPEFLIAPSAESTILLTNPQANTPYYLMMTEQTGAEYQFKEIYFYYDPAE